MNDSHRFNLEGVAYIELSAFSHPSIRCVDGQYWFYETCEHSFPGQLFGMRVKSVHMHTHLAFQDILVFALETYGNVLVLNGIVQCTERDEFAYQETIAHTLLMAHPDPKRVLVIGGGDCGVLREVARHVHAGQVQHVTMVEIDTAVVLLLRRFFPKMAPPHLFSDPKISIVISDGLEFLRNSTEKHDVIITDTLDPEGPAAEFFQEAYFATLQQRLAPGGIVIMQSSENVWLNMPYLQQLLRKARSVFGNVRYCQCYMPSYTLGQLGFVVATNDIDLDLSVPHRTMDSVTESACRYYSKSVHTASFVLPKWAQEALQ